MLFCGHCGRKLHHRSRTRSRNGIYLCVDRKGKWCVGGSIDCAIADEFVSQRFLDRCNFTIDRPGPLTFNEREKRWEQASLLDQRRLLSLAITRVTLVPRPGGKYPQPRSAGGRELEIEWRTSMPDDPLVLVAAAAVGQPRKRRVSEGRSEMMRDLEAAAARVDRASQSARAKAYYQEWASIRRRTLN
jgi:hypothetical protein